jgi:tetratricopeptide (TPR) repeat protein
MDKIRSNIAISCNVSTINADNLNNIKDSMTKTVKYFILLLLLLPIAFGITACKDTDPTAKYNALLEKASQYREDRKLDEARITLRTAIDLKPKEPQTYFELAEVLIRLQQFGPALENYQSALNLDPNHFEARLRLASLYLASKQLELADSNIRKLIESNPDNVETKVLEAGLYSAQGKSEEARQLLNKLRENHPDNNIVLSSIAYLDLAAGKVKEAEELFLKISAADPKNGTVKMALADIYARQQRLDEAQEIMQSLVDEHPDQEGLRFQFAEFLLRRGQSDDAVKQFESTLAGNPLRADARDRLYDIYLIRKQVDKAKALTSSLQEADSKNAAVSYFEGRDLELEGKQEEALKSYLKTITALNSFAPAFRRAGLIEIALGDTRSGVEHLNQAIAIDAQDVGARLGLARVLFARREFTQAKEHLKAVLQLYPKQLGANILWADIALVEGDLKTARVVYEDLLKNQPQNPAAHLKMALLEDKSGNVKQAEQHYRDSLVFDSNIELAAQRLVRIITDQSGQEKAIEEITKLMESSKKSKPEFKLILGALYASKREPEALKKAKTYFSEAVEERPSAFGAYYALAQIDAMEGNIEGSIEKYKKLLEVNPNHLVSRMLLGMTYEKRGNNQDAIAQYREALRINPRFGPAANNLAWLLADSPEGNLDEALEVAKVAKETLPNESNVADTLGWIYFKKGSHRAALPLIQEAIQLAQSKSGNGSVNPEVLYHLGETYFALGQMEDAKKALEESYKLGGEKMPKADRVKELLKKITAEK